MRYLGNRSSGRQGYALAAAAAARGASVVLVSANVALSPPAGVEVVEVGTALELRQAVLAACAPTPDGRRPDALVMAAAVADYRPAAIAEHKLKKTHTTADDDSAPTIELVRNPDVLAELVRERAAAVIVGFAAETGDETGDVLAHGLAKLARKGCDLLVVNDVSSGKVFGRDVTEVTILDAAGGVHPVPAGSKDEAAEAIWDAVLRHG